MRDVFQGIRTLEVAAGDAWQKIYKMDYFTWFLGVGSNYYGAYTKRNAIADSPC
jgi:hypothetical protein